MQCLRKVKDNGMKHILFGIGISNIVIIFLIFLFIVVNGLKFFSSYSVTDFFFGKKWISLSELYGLLPLLVGSFWVTIVALVIAVPVGILTAIYIAEYATPKVRTFLKIIIETMSAIPSVVLGVIGLYVLSGPIKNLFNLSSGLTALTGGIMLAFMALPTIVSIADDSLEALDKSYKEASLALGATKWETITKVILPAAMPGILTGVILSISRAAGETAPIMFTAVAFYLPFLPISYWDQVMALPYHLYVISTQVPNMPPSFINGTLFILVVITLSFNLFGAFIRQRFNSKNK